MNDAREVRAQFIHQRVVVYMNPHCRSYFHTIVDHERLNCEPQTRVSGSSPRL
jgi:hypothetical protein